MQKYILTDGRATKAVINPWDDTSYVSAWDWLSGKPTGDEAVIEDFFAKVPWLRRGVAIISQHVSNIPFIITNLNGDEVDNSEEYQNVVEVIPNPRRMLKLIAESRQLSGRAYQWREYNPANYTKALQYLMPTSVEPVYGKQKSNAGQLVGFKRKYTGPDNTMLEKEVDVDSIVYYWMADPFVEIGPPEHFPARAALNAAGVLFNVDEFVKAFFSRGAIKATILAVPATANKEARDELKTWWGRFMQGAKNMWKAAVFNADAVTPVIIGEGLDGLEDAQLSKSKREDIAAALGIPMSKLFSNEAGGLGGGGVVQQDDIRLYQETIIPEAEDIFSTINEQILEPNGYKIEINKKAIDVFQEDEKERSFSLVNFTSAVNQNPKVAKFGMSLLGYELTDEDLAALDEIIQEKEDARLEMQQNLQANQNNQNNNNGAGNDTPIAQPQPAPEERSVQLVDIQPTMKELGQWQRFASRVGSQRAIDDFKCEYVPEDLEDFVRAGLSDCANEDQVKSLFAAARDLVEQGDSPAVALWQLNKMKSIWREYP